MAKKWKITFHPAGMVTAGLKIVVDTGNPGLQTTEVEGDTKDEAIEKFWAGPLKPAIESIELAE